MPFAWPFSIARLTVEVSGSRWPLKTEVKLGFMVQFGVTLGLVSLSNQSNTAAALCACRSQGADVLQQFRRSWIQGPRLVKCNPNFRLQTVKSLKFKINPNLGFCPHPVTVYIRGPIKGYI